MPFFEHIDELRSRLIKSLAVIVLLFILSIIFSTDIINLLQLPLKAALPQGSSLHFTGPLDVFTASIRVSFLVAIVCASPIWIYHFWQFIEPALYETEKKYLLPFTIVSTLLFFFGICFCFFLILPLTLEFLISLGSEVGTPIITINDYLAMIQLMIFGFGFIFETPLILVLLASLGVVSSQTLANYRRFVIVATLVIGAILTPPDPLSQIAMALPLYVMYEVSIVIIRRLEKRNKVAQKKAS